jgi:hypothetical protein
MILIPIYNYLAHNTDYPKTPSCLPNSRNSNLVCSGLFRLRREDHFKNTIVHGCFDIVWLDAGRNGEGTAEGAKATLPVGDVTFVFVLLLLLG